MYFFVFEMIPDSTGWPLYETNDNPELLILLLELYKCATMTDFHVLICLSYRITKTNYIHELTTYILWDE